MSSSAAGASVRVACAARGAAAVTENGGKDAMVVDAGVDPAWAAEQVATGAFTIGGMTSAVYLLKRRRPDDAVDTGVWRRIPSLARLDLVSYRIHAFAFPVWTFAVLITGPIWAHEAWSRYWNWDPKEVWAFITWVVYAGYLHARATAGWKGRNAAVLALIGVATLWFNFIGINYFSSTSQHSYAIEAPAVVAPLLAE